MISLVADNRNAIVEICRQYGIKKMDVFDSAATGDFDPETSDIDFIVDVGEYSRDVAWRYLDASCSLVGCFNPVSERAAPDTHQK